MPDRHRPAMPQVTAVDDQFGTHRLEQLGLSAPRKRYGRTPDPFRQYSRHATLIAA
jgi:hypothetical protein